MPSIDLAHVPFNDRPIGPVLPQGAAGISIQLDRADMGKSCPLEAKSLAAGASANLERSQLHQAKSPNIRRYPTSIRH
jgi:hypothetical protein